MLHALTTAAAIVLSRRRITIVARLFSTRDISAIIVSVDYAEWCFLVPLNEILVFQTDSFATG